MEPSGVRTCISNSFRVVVARSLRMPIVGRSIAGTVALSLAEPMCRLVGLTDDPRSARTVGAALAASDYAGALNVLLSSAPSRQRKAALTNAGLDVVLASLLLALGLRRRGSQRLAAVAASTSVWFGAGAWLKAANSIHS